MDYLEQEKNNLSKKSLFRKRLGKIKQLHLTNEGRWDLDLTRTHKPGPNQSSDHQGAKLYCLITGEAPLALRASLRVPNYPLFLTWKHCESYCPQF